MNSGKDDFLVTTPNQVAHFRNGGFRINAPASAANRWNDAEGTVGIAPILDFHDRARSTAGPDVRCGLELALEKNAAAHDFGSAMCTEILIG